MTTFVTLGPGTNHDVVARRYLAFHGLDATALRYVRSPERGVDLLLAGEADYMILCSVHPGAAAVTGHLHRPVVVVDSFISASKPLAILTRTDVAKPVRLGLFAPTAGYVDASPWAEVVLEHEGSLVELWERLLAGAYDSALVYAEYATGTDRVRVDVRIDSPVDAWVVFGRNRALGDSFSACLDSAVGRALARPSQSATKP